MRHKLLCGSCMVAVAVIGAAPAYADPKSGGAECGNSKLADGPIATSSPGNAATSPGSVFNEPGVNSVNGGKGNVSYDTKARNNKNFDMLGAPAQYDRACARVTANDSGTPIQPTPDANMTNNSRATRDALGVVSHMGSRRNQVASS